MYSAVLMLALTAGSESVDFGRNRCHGCTTTCSSAVVVSGCTHSCASSCHARTRLFGGHGCHSCFNGCTTVVSHCCTVSRCHSSCHGGLFARRHCCSNVCHGCTVTTTCCNGNGSVPAVKTMPKSGEPVPAPKKVGLNVPATIVVSLPADARLIVDGAATASTTERRTLVTPALEVGSTYVYTMRAEIVREGRTVAQEQIVNVRGGQVFPVQFSFPTSVASR